MTVHHRRLSIAASDERFLRVRVMRRRRPILKFILLLVVTGVLLARPSLAASNDKKKKILSFGGNGMIGSATLSRLIQDESYEITLVSRGTWPFDSAQVIQPHVHAIVCDREDSLQSCEDLMSVIQSVDEFYAVLDFSGFERQWIENALQVLEDKARVYIYISTDSVYEVSEGAQEDTASNRRGLPSKSVESQAVRPTDPTVRQRLNAMDEYGNAKLAGEEALMTQKIPYVALRFADVIGPRDGTERWMLYHVWIKYSQAIGIPLSVPNNVAKITTSITFVEDAASSIILAMETKTAWNEAYNIACEEGFNVVSGIGMIADSLGVDRDGIDIKTMPPDESFAVYPSVRRGPMDISKARNVLNFTPTPLEKVLRATAEWYETVPMQDELMRQYMLEEFIEDALDADDDDVIEKLLSAVGQEYGVDYAFNGDDDEYNGGTDHSDL